MFWSWTDPGRVAPTFARSESRWLLDVLEGRKPPNLNRKVVLHADRGLGVYGPDAPGFFLPERLRVE